jgi:hypothetical protein
MRPAGFSRNFHIFLEDAEFLAGRVPEEHSQPVFALDHGERIRDADAHALGVREPFLWDRQGEFFGILVNDLLPGPKADIDLKTAVILVFLDHKNQAGLSRSIQ